MKLPWMMRVARIAEIDAVAGEVDDGQSVHFAAGVSDVETVGPGRGGAQSRISMTALLPLLSVFRLAPGWV